MTRLTALFETTRATYRDPVYATDRTAAMAHIDCSFPWGTDPIAPLVPQMAEIASHLDSTPEHLRMLYLYGIGVPAVKAWNCSPGHNWSTGKPPDPRIGKAQADFIAGRGFAGLPVWTDFEEPFFTTTGAYDSQNKRTAYMRAVLKPFKGERINFNFVKIPTGKRINDAFGNPMQSGVIGQTSSPCSYARNRAEWAQHRRDVETCIRPVMPHYPPRWTEDGRQTQTAAEALQQVREGILWDCARGVTRVGIAAYMFDGHQAELVQTAHGALADAESILFPEEAAA